MGYDGGAELAAFGASVQPETARAAARRDRPRRARPRHRPRRCPEAHAGGRHGCPKPRSADAAPPAERPRSPPLSRRANAGGGTPPRRLPRRRQQPRLPLRSRRRAPTGRSWRSARPTPKSLVADSEGQGFPVTRLQPGPEQPGARAGGALHRIRSPWAAPRRSWKTPASTHPDRADDLEKP